MGDRLRGNAKFPVKILVRRARSERCHADKNAVGTDDGIPALPNGGFYTDFHASVADDGASIFVFLFQEQFEARHRNHARRNPLLRKQLCAVDGNRNFRAGGEDRDVRAAIGSRYLISAARADIVVIESVAQLWKILPCERKNARPAFSLERELPALGRFHRIAGAEHKQIWNRAKGGEMLDWLMRRPIFAKADGVMRHYVDNTLAHQRGEPDCWAAI